MERKYGDSLTFEDEHGYRKRKRRENKMKEGFTGMTSPANTAGSVSLEQTFMSKGYAKTGDLSMAPSDDMTSL
jgi:hypothetical protein